jgi:AcrR family transcriptional regulator
VRRGVELRQHILFTAKDVFLEMGFEAASMDVIAERAETTKRTLYAHFASKERLFLAVVDLLRDLLDAKLQVPADYADDPTEALVLFCSRLQHILRWGPAIRTCRLGIAEAERFPAGAARFYAALFGTARQRVAQFLQERFALPHAQSTRTAEDLLGRVLYPGFTRALFGVDPVSEDWVEEAASSPPAELALIRSAIAELVQPVPAVDHACSRRRPVR